MIQLSILDRLYSLNNFSNILLGTLIFLVGLFCVILFLGLRDKKKRNTPKIKDEFEDMIDITFDMPKEVEQIKEDVSFEMTTLTDNLEEFKKNLENEMEMEDLAKEELAQISSVNSKKLDESTKPFKILSMDEIEETSIIETDVILASARQTEVLEVSEDSIKTDKKSVIDQIKESNVNGDKNKLEVE